MKILTKQEEAEHYHATVTGGIITGLAGLAIGTVGVLAASRRYHFVNNLTLPLKAFLVTSSGTFAGIIGADHSSRAFESARNPIDREFKEREAARAEAEIAGKTFTQRALDFGKKERYKIVGASWIASMAAAFSIVNRNKYLTGAQKLVQARVYAQFLTLGVLVASAAFEISDSKNDQGHWETVKVVDPNDPSRTIERKERVGGPQPVSDGDDLWKDMVAAEEERMKEREEEDKKYAKEHSKAKKPKADSKKEAKKDDKTDEPKKDDKKDDKSDAPKKDDKKDGGQKADGKKKDQEKSDKK